MGMGPMRNPPAATHDLWYGTSGPPDAEIVIVGESWGAEEAIERKPFIGQSGVELTRMLAEAGIDRSKCLLTNVVAARPDNNEMWRLFLPKHRGERIGGLQPSDLVKSEVRRLQRQIAAFPRKLVIACGSWALWALSDCAGTEVLRSSNNRMIPVADQPFAPTGIMSWRGSMWYTTHDRFHELTTDTDTPLLPIIHPASILRQWSNRAVTVHDLKARTRMALRNDWRPDPSPRFLAPPTFEQTVGTLQGWLALASSGGPPVRLAEDIETARGLITCLGIADSPRFAISIPFVRINEQRGFDSWWTLEQECEILSLLRRINSHPNIQIEGQNFLYDTQYIQAFLAVTPRLSHDTMLCQNVLFPGSTKALDYLSSLFCKYHWYWKEDAKEWDMKGSIEDLLLYNCWDCVRTWEIGAVQRALVVQMGQEWQMSLKMRIHELCLKMMNRGVLIDTSRRNALSLDLMTAMQELENELIHIVPQAMVDEGAKTPWYRSDKQTATLFYDILGFKPVMNRKTGRPTVGKEARSTLKAREPEFSGLFERLRMYGSAENTHTVLNAGLDAGNRLRCSYNPAGTETHRLSSSKTAFGRGTNLQNLTKGEEDD